MCQFKDITKWFARFLKTQEIQDDAMDALLDTLGGPEPEPEEDPTPVAEVSEVTPHSFIILASRLWLRSPRFSLLDTGQMCKITRK